MKLRKATDWARTHFHESTRPDTRTIRKWIHEEKVPGIVIDGQGVYVDEEQWAELYRRGGNPDVDMIDEAMRGAEAPR